MGNRLCEKEKANDKQKKSKKGKERYWGKCNKKFVIFMIFLIILMPSLIALVIYKTSWFAFIPGGDQVWLGFWASYSGALATVVVAYVSMEGNKKLEDVNQNLKKRENDYISTLIGVNIRLHKVYIIPQRAEKKDENTVISKYLMRFIFKNVSYTMVQAMVIDKVIIENKQYNIEGKGNFLLEGESLALEIIIPMPRGSEEEKKFSQFYFYYSQFRRNKNSLDVVITTDINQEQENKKVQIEMKLKMEPEREENSFSNKVKIVSYKILPVDINMAENSTKEEAEEVCTV